MTDHTDISTVSVRDALARIGDANHCQAGATTAMIAGLAAALGQAVAGVTLIEKPSREAAAAAREAQSAFASARERLLEIADDDATAIGEFVALRERGEALRGYELLCDGPLNIATLAVSCTRHMQDFRAHVCERSRDDLEFAIVLMTGAARAATLLLDSNLRIWPLPELLARYEPKLVELFGALGALQPREHIRH